MSSISARDIVAKFGPCRVVDAHGDVLLGSIVEADLDTGVYVVVRQGDHGQVEYSVGRSGDELWVLYERCEAAPPLRLVPIKEDKWA